MWPLEVIKRMNGEVSHNPNRSRGVTPTRQPRQNVPTNRYGEFEIAPVPPKKNVCAAP